MGTRSIPLGASSVTILKQDKPLITDLTVVVPKLVRLLPDTVPSSEQLARFKRESEHIDFPFHVPVEKGLDSHIDYIAVVKIGAHSSLKEAEEHYVWRLGILLRFGRRF